MDTPQTEWAKVLRAHPDFSHHMGEIVEIDSAKMAEYNDQSPFFGPATPAEITRQQALTETATLPVASEKAVLPPSGAKTPEQAAKTLETAKK